MSLSFDLIAADIKRTKHQVAFYSHGDNMPEFKVCDIESWDVEEAAHMAKLIEYTSMPFKKVYGFEFITTGQSKTEPDRIESVKSEMYYKGLDYENKNSKA